MTKSPLPFFGLCCSNKSNTFGYSDGFRLVPFFLSGCGSGNLGEINHNLQTWVVVARPIKTTFCPERTNSWASDETTSEGSDRRENLRSPREKVYQVFSCSWVLCPSGVERQTDDAPLLQRKCCNLWGLSTCRRGSGRRPQESGGISLERGPPGWARVGLQR